MRCARWNHRRILLVVLVASASIVLVGTYAWLVRRSVTPEQLAAVNLEGNWEDRDLPSWVPKVVQDLIPRDLAYISSRGGEWHPEADALIARVAPVDTWYLHRTPIPDRSVRRLIAAHPGMIYLDIDGAEITPQTLREILALEHLKMLQVDGPALSDSDLIAAAAEVDTPVLDATIARRLVRRFCGGRPAWDDDQLASWETPEVHFGVSTFAGGAVTTDDGDHVRTLPEGVLSRREIDFYWYGEDRIGIGLACKRARTSEESIRLTDAEWNLLRSIKRFDSLYLSNIEFGDRLDPDERLPFVCHGKVSLSNPSPPCCVWRRKGMTLRSSPSQDGVMATSHFAHSSYRPRSRAGSRQRKASR